MSGLVTIIENAYREGNQSRTRMMQENWEIYYGRGDKPLKVESGGADDNACNNYAKVIVDKSVAFLFGKEIKFDIESGKQTKDEVWLEACWQANRKMSLLQKLALAGSVCGTAFIRIYNPAGSDFPRLILLDPETVTVISAEDDFENVLQYIETYPSVDEKGNAVSIRRVYTKNKINWTIEEQRATGGDFITLETYNWVYEFAPILHCQNLANPFEIWGESDLSDSLKEAIKTNDFVWSNMRKILRHHAHPITVAKGVRADGIIKAGVGDVLVLEAEGADMKNLEMQSDLASSLEYSKRQVEFIHELARVPEVATGKVQSVGQLSGIALEILYQPLLEKTEAKRVTYGEMITELNRRLLEIGKGIKNVYPRIIWQELLPKDDQIVASAAVLKHQLGVSLESLMRELGYDPDSELVRWYKEQNNLGNQLLKEFDNTGIDTEN